MGKIAVKDLPIGIKIKCTKKRLLSVPKIVKEKCASYYRSLAEKVKNYITEEDKKSELNKKVDSIKAKRSELYDTRRKMLKQEEFVSGEKKYLLEAIEEEIEKYVDKSVKLKNKGLGVFSIGKVYVKKYISNQREKANKRKAKRELEKTIKVQLREKEKEKKLKEQLEEINNKKLELDANIKQMTTQNPKLVNYLNKLNSKEKDAEKKIVPIKSIRKATEEEKTAIKSSNRFKKAVAILSAVVVSVGISLGVFTAINNNGIPAPTTEISQTGEQTELDSGISQNQEEQDTQLKLNSYVNLQNGSKIFDSSTLDGKSGQIGTNGYDNDTLFKVNAVSYNNNGVVTTFNLVGQDEKAAENIQLAHEEYVKNNPNAKLSTYHITPCDESGKAIDSNGLGGWTTQEHSQTKTVDLNNVSQNTVGGLKV